jgi:HAD superfamily phosphatase (TIGR01668 family)
MRLLEPWHRIEHVSAIDLEALRGQGVEALLLDMDNTVVPWHTFDIEERTKHWVSTAKALGFRICILSNNHRWRIERLCGMLGVQGVWNACKPFLGGYLRAMRAVNATSSQSVLVGDQLFTDVLGANVLGIRTILVSPLSSRELGWTRFMRRVERLFGRPERVSPASENE